MTDEPALPDKLYFKIGEVARLVGVKPYVLRYWESEFAGVLRPGKTEARHRLYRRKDVETLRTIKRLLHEERYTIEGARRKLRQGAERDAALREAAVPPPAPMAGVPSSATISVVPPPVVETPPLELLVPPPARVADAPSGESRSDAASILARVRQELREICRRLDAEPGEAPPLQIG